ncbi:MAG TPA: glycoside hydrolase domain-containing protein, partial [Bacteroidales bacterium]|nr:glycoside hydrolase domain-containing protein [Bacteroidales bacterium]
TVKGTACKGEYFTFQLGLYCINEKINDLDIEFTDLISGRNDVVVKSEDISSFNTGGINWNGQKFKKEVIVDPGKVQPLWFGFMIPENTDADKINGTMVVKPKNREPETLRVKITIRDKVIENHGDNKPEDMTRLRWLNSQIAVNDDITKPFIRIERENKTLNILGRSLNIGSTGLFSGYTTFFNESNTEIGNQGQNILALPMSFDIYRSNGTKIFFVKEPTKFTVEKPGKYEWKNKCSSAGIEMTTAGTLEFDGYASVKVTLKAKEDIALSDIRFSMHLRKKFAGYFMGLGLKGGNRPYYISWKWDRMKHQEGAWIGNVNGGLQFSLRDDKYERPLNTNFYREKPLVMPESWYNEGRGGINISSGNYTADVNCYTGRRNLKEGDELVFRINFLFTPFKPVNTNKHWHTRYYHRYKEVDSIIDYGANVVNVHHATEINPWINYPFLEQEKMKAYIDEAHSKGLRVKLYNTIRELSNRAPELFAIRSLGHEIFSPGEGGGFNWLQEHLVDDYIAAWFVPRYRDAAIINSGMSRWHNYYIEGINWLTKEMGIDGLYLDDIAFDRTTMKRLRKVLDNNNDSALIDLHSANQYNVRDGFTNSANLYMEHFPYINRLWFGEYFDPSLPPDYWLVEMSGLPFGLMGEMLQDGGNQYRGLLYGMTSRAPWSGDPRNIWSLFDKFGMHNCRFIGYWSESCPVSTGYRNAPASVYQKNGRVMVALASWYEVNKELWLNVDWEKLGIKRDDVIYHAPYVKNFQEEKTFSPWERIPLEAGKGMVIFIEKK